MVDDKAFCQPVTFPDKYSPVQLPKRTDYLNSKKSDHPARIAIVGSGAAGLAAAWLLSRQYEVVVFEANEWVGGHAHSAFVEPSSQQLADTNTNAGSFATQISEQLVVDTGFIVYNEATYPNYKAWMTELGVTTQATDMSFAVSRDDGGFEYAGGPLPGLFAQKTNVLRPRFWRMLRDIVRFYREAVDESAKSASTTLGEFLRERRYSQAFIDDHLLPFGAAIWSTPQEKMLAYPLRSFVRFCDNHGLLKLAGRPQWRTVTGGSANYVKRVTEEIAGNGGSVHTNCAVTGVRREPDSACLITDSGDSCRFDQVVFACHADQALKLLQRPSAAEQDLLGKFAYEENRAVLHTDERVMPKRRAAWSSWNYVETEHTCRQSKPGVVYWMNKLQSLPGDVNYFVSLNPQHDISGKQVLRETIYYHPLFSDQTYTAQQALWSLQGKQRTWFCGSYFGSGFHEDAVQAGLAVAEELGGLSRPWYLDNPSSRIFLPSHAPSRSGLELRWPRNFDAAF